MKNNKLLTILLCIVICLCFATFVACEDPETPPTPIEVTAVEIYGDEYVMSKPNQTLQFSATVKPENATDKSVTWSVDGTNLATTDYVFENGKLTLKNDAVGYVVLKVSSVGENAKTDRVFVTVNADFPVQTQYHKVVFKTAEGQVICGMLIADGADAVAPNYKVEGKIVTWDKSLENIKADTVINAVVSEIRYSVSFFYMVGDIETQIGETQFVSAPDVAVAPDAPTVEGKEFVDWDYTIDGYTVKAVAVYVDSQQ